MECGVEEMEEIIRQMREILEQGYSKCGPQGDTRSYKLPTESEGKHLKQFDRVIVCFLNLIIIFLIVSIFLRLFYFIFVAFLLHFQKSVHRGLEITNEKLLCHYK